MLAQIAEQVGYRLNRIPEKNHVELLKLLGVPCVIMSRARIRWFGHALPLFRALLPSSNGEFIDFGQFDLHCPHAGDCCSRRCPRPFVT